MTKRKGYHIDKRVDRFIVKQGYFLDECEIFYSPISSFFGYMLLLLAMSFQFIFSLLLNLEDFSFNIYVFLSILSYLLVGYLIYSYKNNSFVITNDKLLVVNRNYPFHHFKEYKLSSIKKVKIHYSNYWTHFLFLILIANYVEVYQNFEKKRFYCIYLEEDYFDENNVEKIIDDLNYTLKSKNVKTEFMIYKGEY